MSLENEEFLARLEAGIKTPRKKGRPAKAKPEPKTPKKQEHARLPQEKPSSEFVNKVGKTTYYEPWMCDKIIEIASQGGSRSKMIVALGIRREATINEWCEKYPEFREAYAISKHYHLAYLEDINLENAKGEIKGNATSMALMLNNYHPEIYKRNPDATGGGHTEININTINLSPEQMDTAIKQKIQLLRSFGLEFDPTKSTITDAVVISNSEDKK